MYVNRWRMLKRASECALVCGWALSGCKHVCIFPVRQLENVWRRGEVTQDRKLMQTNTPTLNQTPEEHTVGLITVFLSLQQDRYTWILWPEA